MMKKVDSKDLYGIQTQKNFVVGVEKVGVSVAQFVCATNTSAYPAL